MLIHHANVRDPPMMSIAAYIVGMRQAGMRRTVAAVILSAFSHKGHKNDYWMDIAQAIITLCLLWLKISGPQAHGAVVAAGDEAGAVGKEGEGVDAGILTDGSRATAFEIPNANSAVQ